MLYGNEQKRSRIVNAITPQHIEQVSKDKETLLVTRPPPATRLRWGGGPTCCAVDAIQAPCYHCGVGAAQAMGEALVKTLFAKVWDGHVVAEQEDETLLYVDRCLIHEGSRHTFDTLRERGL